MTGLADNYSFSGNGGAVVNQGLYTDTVWAVPVQFKDTAGAAINLSGHPYVAEVVSNNVVVFSFRSSGAATTEGTLDLTNAATGTISFNATIAQHAGVKAGLYRLHLKRDQIDDVWQAEGTILIGDPGAKETYIVFDDPGAEVAGSMTYAMQAAASATEAVGAAGTAVASASSATASASTATTKASQATAAATAAAASQTAAASSADTASGAAGAASASAATATTKASEASSSATAAAGSASSAAGSAGSAAASASTAATKASEASGSATAAANSAASASASATSAGTSAANIEAAYGPLGSIYTARDQAVASAADASSSKDSASSSATSAAQSALIASTYSVAAGLDSATLKAQAAASLAQGYAASASSVVQQDLSGITAQALHRSPNAITGMFIYDTSRDSDGGAWTKKCQHTSWFNEALAGKWLGPADTELQARCSGGTLGSELITDSTAREFSSDSGWWTKGAGVTIANGAAAFSSVASGAGLSRATMVTSGKLYQVTFDITSYTSGGVRAVMTANGQTRQGTGRFTDYFVATGTTFAIQATAAGTTLSIDNVSVKEVTALNTASNDYYQLSTDGKFYRLWKNLIPYSEQFDNAAWTKVGATITPNSTAAPTGAVTADTVSVTAGSTQYLVRDFSGDSYVPRVLSVHILKSAGAPASYPAIAYYNASGQGRAVVLNPQTGAISDATGAPRAGRFYFSGGASAATVEDAGTYWRLSIRTESNAHRAFEIIPAYNTDGSVNALQTGSASAVIWGAQVEYGSVLTAYEAKAAEVSASEIIRGNKAEFPKLAGIVAEAASVTIYDLTEPGRPMWMRFSNTGSTNTVVRGSNAGPLFAMGGILCIGHGTSFGLAKVDFATDKATLLTATGEYLPRPISGRNDTTFTYILATSAAQGPSVVSATIYGLAMTVLPDAPIDPATGLCVPTIAVATNGGLTVINDNGIARNDTTLGFAHVAFDPSGNVYYARDNFNLTMRYATPAMYRAASGFGANFASGASPPAFGVAAMVGSSIAATSRARLIGRSSAFSGVTRIGVGHYQLDLARPARSLVTHITNTYNSGWMTGDIRRCYLSDVTAETIAGTELVTNGAFSGGTTGWSLPTSDETISIVAGRLRMTMGPDGNRGDNVTLGAYQDVSGLVVGKIYRLFVGERLVGTNGAAGVRVTLPGNGTSIAQIYSFANATNEAVVFVATATTLRVTVFTGYGTSGTYVEVGGISVVEAVADRSWRTAVAPVIGTLTKAALATGTSLVGFSGFSAANYLREPYSADLDFGTGEWTASAWVNIPATMPDASFPVIPTERVTNGTFDSNLTGWGVAVNITATWVSGEAEITTGGGIDASNYSWFSQTVLVTDDTKRYKVEFDATWVSGTANLQVGTGYSIRLSIPPNGGVKTRYSFISARGGAGGDALRNAIVFGGPTGGVWRIDNVSVKELAPACIFDRAHSSGPRIRMGVVHGGAITAEAFDGTTTRTVTTTTAYNNATWHKVRARYTTDGTLAILVNGREVAATRGNPLLTLNNSSAVLTIGNSYALDAPFPGSIALLTLGATVPTNEQGLFMYEQEKQLFRAGAQSVLPDSGNTTDMSYDEATDRWVVTSAANESYWTGLVRNSVTPVAAGSYSKIAAGSGVELAARSTTIPGVDVTIPAYGLRSEMINKAEAAARLGKDQSAFDYVGGFTASTTSGSTAISSVAGLSYPTSYIGAQVSGTGIPAGTTIVAVSGTTIYLSAAATATATGVSISFLDFILPAGMEAKEVAAAGVIKQEGSTKDYTRLYDGFLEIIRFGTAPGVTAWVQIKAQRITLQ